MNHSTTQEIISEQLQYRELEVKHLNAVNKELQDELTAYKACASAVLEMSKMFGMCCDTVADVDTEQLVQFIAQVKSSAMANSDKAGQLDVTLSIVMAQLETLKADMRQVNRGYNFSKLKSVSADFDMARFGQAFARITRQNLKPELWAIINAHPVKVVRNLETDKRDSALCHFSTCGAFDLLHDALEHSAADLLHREEI